MSKRELAPIHGPILIGRLRRAGLMGLIKRAALALSIACVVVAVGPPRAAALAVIWQPLEHPTVGNVGSGTHSEVKGMAIYTTPPAKPYVIVGLIFARKGTFISPRTRAVALAKKVGANALMLLDPDQLEMGRDTTTSGDLPEYRIRYTGVVYYAAIQWSRAVPPHSSPNDIAPPSDRVDRALPAQAASP
ncbi:hypothetical protein [Methylacidimicrobium tartarophylax]|uniref:hypothetical protein n=1 Tax=Methylacidimicrobium tartarophylax TaxID=1041768 RepID=UPI001158E5DA|nr:hypothetical protein [Methylacidimicrobium tartarophylax]